MRELPRYNDRLIEVEMKFNKIHVQRGNYCACVITVATFQWVLN